MAIVKRGRNEFKDWWKPKPGEENTTDYEWFRNTKAYKYCKDVSENKIRTNRLHENTEHAGRLNFNFRLFYKLNLLL